MASGRSHLSTPKSGNPAVRTRPSIMIFTLAVIAAALAWLAGGGLAIAGRHPLEAPGNRLIVVGVILLIGIGFALLRPRRSTAQPDGGATDAAINAEVHLIGRQLAAINAPIRRGFAYRSAEHTPWYLVLGAPGAGKTVLSNGLIASPAAPAAAPAAEGAETIGCRCLQGDRTTIIDVAGRVLTDERLWSGLLDQVKTLRPRQPINGLIVALDAAALIALAGRDLQALGAFLKRRFVDVSQRLGVAPPVYVVITKTDRLAGFTAFFDDVPPAERSQPWGGHLPDVRANETLDDRLQRLFEDLGHRLDARLQDRMYLEPDPHLRAAAFGFPLQFAALAPALRTWAAAVWDDPADATLPRLRAIHLTAARQSDQTDTVDALATRVGLAAAREPDTPLDGATPFFIGELMAAAYRPEAGLVGEDPRLVRGRRVRRQLATAAAFVVALALTLFWANSYRGNAALIRETETGLARVEAALRPLNTPPRTLNRIDDTDFALLLPALDAMRALPGANATGDGWPPLALSGGLYQGNRLGQSAREIYARALRTQFLSRIVLRIEDQMRAAWLRPEALQPALKVYLMLGGKLPLDRAAVSAWLDADWQAMYPADADRRQALNTHLATLFTVGFAPTPLDATLALRAEKVLAGTPLPEKS